jgi:hypothetical protein
MDRNKPLYSIYILVFLNYLILSVALSIDFYNADNIIQFISGISLRTIISIILSSVFLCCYARNMKLAWHIAFWYMFLGIPIIMILDPYQNPNPVIARKVKIFLGIFWLIYSSYMICRYKPI